MTGLGGVLDCLLVLSKLSAVFMFNYGEFSVIISGVSLSISITKAYCVYIVKVCLRIYSFDF